jgi:hypothetical protein
MVRTANLLSLVVEGPEPDGSGRNPSASSYPAAHNIPRRRIKRNSGTSNFVDTCPSVLEDPTFTVRLRFHTTGIATFAVISSNFPMLDRSESLGFSIG